MFAKNNACRGSCTSNQEWATQPPRKPPPIGTCRISSTKKGHFGRQNAYAWTPPCTSSEVPCSKSLKKRIRRKNFDFFYPQKTSWTNQQLGALSHSNTFLPKKIINPTKTHSFRSTWMRSTKTYCYLGIVTGGFKMGSLLKMYKWLVLKQKTIWIHITFPGVLHSPPKKKNNA